MAEHVRVAVIGGGAVGCSVLYHLARLGWADALLLEQDELTSGSTWHAAGNCPTFSGSWGILKLQAYSARLYQQLGEIADYPIGYHITGSVRLSHTGDRLREFRHVRGMARANGIDYEVLSPSELRDRYPLAELHDLNGALWDPLDGDIDPAQLTQAFAAAARKLGATVRRFAKVFAIAQRTDGAWVVRARDAKTGEETAIVADVVVNAAGYRAGEVMALLGQHLPTVSMSHQYLVTDDVPDLLARDARLPLLRDPDSSYYLRQERGGFILGPYEWQATPMWLDGIPEDFSYKLWNDDLQRLDRYIEDACARVPALRTAGIKRVVNGPIPYSPDGNPYLGPARGLRNFFHCNTFSFGICQAGGAGKAMAEWVIEGGPEWDLWPLDPRRFTSYATRSFVVAKAVEVYQNEYAPSFPNEERPAGRPLRTSPLYDRLRAKGARYAARGGWERPAWFARHDEAADAPGFARARPYLGAVGEEVRAVRERVGLLDLPGFTKFIVTGPNAARWLDRLVCTKLPRVGRVALAWVLNERGRIVSEFTITHQADNQFYLCSAASAEWHDADVLRAALATAPGVHVQEVSPRYGTLVLAGPRARDVLSAVTEADLSNAAFPWLSARQIEIGSAHVLAMRVTYVGELGWELHAPMEDMVALHEALERAGAPHGMADFGIYAVDSMRLDKCYRGWKADLETGFSPLDASLDRFVAWDKPEFVGRVALHAERARGPAWRFVPLLLDDAGDTDAPGCASVFAGGERVGIVTSGGWSYTLGKSVALAYVRADLSVPGARVGVDVFGERRAAMVATEPLYDPTNARLRA